MLQGALVIYDCERNVCIKSIYKTLREEGRRVKEIQEGYREIPPLPLSNRVNP